MWRKRCCGGKNRLPIGYILIASGIGVLMAYIIPYYILITLLGIALIVAGVRIIRKR